MYSIEKKDVAISVSGPKTDTSQESVVAEQPINLGEKSFSAYSSRKEGWPSFKVGDRDCSVSTDPNDLSNNPESYSLTSEKIKSFKSFLNHFCDCYNLNGEEDIKFLTDFYKGLSPAEIDRCLSFINVRAKYEFPIELYNLSAKALYNLGHYEKANICIEKIMAATRSYPKFDIALFLKERGKNDLAEKLFNDILESRSDYGYEYRLREIAELYFDTDREKSLELFGKIKEDLHIPYIYERAMLFLEEKGHPLAEEFRKSWPEVEENARRAEHRFRGC